MRSIGMLVVGFLGSAALAVACNGGGGTDTDTGVCAGGEMACDGECVNANIDEDHCGACDNACAAGENCANGVCAPECGVGMTKCGEQCIDTLTDPGNCGGCGIQCEANAMCLLGQCMTCSAGLELCDNSCVDLDTNNTHCGACGNACDPGVPCSGGACGLNCGPQELECDNLCVDAMVDPNNCGGCGMSCDADQMCASGACVDECDPGQTQCDGACVDTNTSTDHCGACNNACGAQETCESGACAVPCAADEELCGETCVDTQTSPDHCGACDAACEYTNASALCDAGACAMGPCDSGWADLDGDPGTGCESEAPRRAFVSSKTYNGNLGGVAGADAKCQALATTEGLGGTWRAWLSDDDSNPAGAFTQTMSQLKRIDDAVIAEGWGDLVDGELQSPISINEGGNSVGASIVWTNTAADGTALGPDSCANWTSAQADVHGVSGNTAATDTTWTDNALGPCNSKRRLYCFEL